MNRADEAERQISIVFALNANEKCLCSLHKEIDAFIPSLIMFFFFFFLLFFSSFSIFLLFLLSTFVSHLVTFNYIAT